MMYLMWGGCWMHAWVWAMAVGSYWMEALDAATN